MRTGKARDQRIGGASRRRPTGAFTLVEIVAAMALAVIIMLGIVQVFKMSADAVTVSEATTDSYQMARGIFSILQNDLSRFTSEGYLYVQPQRILNPTSNSAADRYNFDTLMFTTVGRFQEMGTGRSKPMESGAAEVMYSYARRAYKGKITPHAGTAFNEKDARGVCLIRKAFLNAGEMTRTTVLPLDSVTKPRSCFVMMQTENKWKSSPMYRISPMRVNSTGYGNMAQVVDADESGGFDANVNYIIGDRVSEFMVEVWTYANGALGWRRSIRESTQSDGEPNYLWCGSKRNPDGEISYNNVTYSHWAMPRMIRVTLVVHPHNDQAPLEDQDYAHTSIKKYRGEVFRQVFRLSGVRGGRMEVPSVSGPGT